MDVYSMNTATDAAKTENYDSGEAEEKQMRITTTGFRPTFDEIPKAKEEPQKKSSKGHRKSKKNKKRCVI